MTLPLCLKITRTAWTYVIYKLYNNKNQAKTKNRKYTQHDVTVDKHRKILDGWQNKIKKSSNINLFDFQIVIMICIESKRKCLFMTLEFYGNILSPWSISLLSLWYRQLRHVLLFIICDVTMVRNRFTFVLIYTAIFIWCSSPL